MLHWWGSETLKLGLKNQQVVMSQNITAKRLCSKADILKINPSFKNSSKTLLFSSEKRGSLSKESVVLR